MNKVFISALAWAWLALGGLQAEAKDFSNKQSLTYEELCSTLQIQSKEQCVRILQCWGAVSIGSYLNREGGVSRKEEFIYWNNTATCVFFKKDELNKDKNKQKTKPKVEEPLKTKDDTDIDYEV